MQNKGLDPFCSQRLSREGIVTQDSDIVHKTLVLVHKTQL